MNARYAELQTTSNFSFLRGASHPEEFALTAAALGHAAVALTDRNSLAGVVRLYSAARAHGIRPIVGVRLVLTPGEADAPGTLCPELLAYPLDLAGYAALSRSLTAGKRRAAKGACHLYPSDIAALAAAAPGRLAVAVVAPEAGWASPELAGELAAWRRVLAPCAPVYLALSPRYDGTDRRRLAALTAAAERAGLAPLATNDGRYHRPARRRLQDVLTCIRLGCPIDEAGSALESNAERHLKTPDEMARLFRAHPQALANVAALLDRIRFDLGELSYAYPDESGPGESAQQRLERLTEAGAHRRYPGGVPEGVRAQLDHELALIGRLGYADYFLTVARIVDFARSRGIFCQGRGSAANSAVCYCLGITAVDPARSQVLFERFISEARGEPPDIDVDFEHERRDEVIRFIYETYGSDHAALAATVICYRARGALREVGKALGLTVDVVERLQGGMWGSREDAFDPDAVREAGLDPEAPRLALTLELARELIGFPRHLSQHVGGFVIARPRLDGLVPIANAAMAGRTTIEWDKDDLESLGLLKIDILALGMLSCLRRAFDLLAVHHGRCLDLASVPAEDPATFDMLSRADSLGVFQVESRAQMNMLPRLQPREFYDLVIEVAIVRPGPIQGDMVHPYLQRRQGREPVAYPSEALRRVLGKTLGVPLFQEQAMQIAITAAGFSAAEADRLRRALATFRKHGNVHHFRDKMVEGMVANGYDREFAERCFQQIEGFGTYGFPESHAASFALLVYVSAWLKCHYPAVFACALLNSQPMGFYAPAQILRDARAHGVVVRPVCVQASYWDNTLEESAGAAGQPALRLGFRQVVGLKQAELARLIAARPSAGYSDIAGLARAAGLPAETLERLAEADAFAGLGYGRRDALWAIKALPGRVDDLPLFAEAGGPAEGAAPVPAMGEGEQVMADYRSTRLSLRRHPVTLLGAGLQADFDAALRAEDTAQTPENPVSKGGAVGSVVVTESRKNPAAGSVAVTESPKNPEAGSVAVTESSSRPYHHHPAEHPDSLADERSRSRAQCTPDTARLRDRPTRPPSGGGAQANGDTKGLVRRPRLTPLDRLAFLKPQSRVAVAGIVTVRQRPGSAKGVVFVTLEDGGGTANLVLFPDVFEAYRRTVIAGRLLGALGRLERSPEGIVHIRVQRVLDLSASLARLSDGAASADLPLAGGDEVGTDRVQPEDYKAFPARSFG